MHKKILTHLGLYLVSSKAPPRASPRELRLVLYTQVWASEDDLHAEPEYSTGDDLF
jgi:hypothetical protein